MKPFDFIHNYFGFNRGERNGLLILLAIILILLLVRFFISDFIKSDSTIKITKIQTLEKKDSIIKNPSLFLTKKNDASPYSSTKLFAFDPNLINEEEANLLGFDKKLIKRLINYREKGGKFYKKEDLKKLYGINEKLYGIIENYIVIELREKEKKTENIKFPATKKELLELNHADSLQLVALPKIGPYTVKKILKFRNALGGFQSINQIKEIYGMTDSLYLFLTERVYVDERLIQLININSADYNELKKHPYINHIIASTLIAYREKHGKYKSADDLKLVGTIDEPIINQLKNYFSFD